MKQLCFIDCETTGLDPNYHEIIEFSAIKVLLLNKRMIITDELTLKIKPNHTDRIDPKSITINGYNAFQWENADNQNECVHKIGSIIHNSILCGHNVAFDVSFLKSFLSNNKCYDYKISHNNIDTKVLAYEHLVPCGLKSLSLDGIRAFFGWKVYKHHSARIDVLDTYRLYRKLNKATILNRLLWKCGNKLKSL